jgi:type IV secretory pathway VirB2 component (pilin)
VTPGSYQRDLFQPAAPKPIESSLAWIETVLFGQVAVTLCVLAVALIGILMLTGRLPLRRGLMVVIGIFVLLGAPSISYGLLMAVNG